MELLPKISEHFLANMDENVQTYQGEFLALIWHQILITNLQGNLAVEGEN